MKTIYTAELNAKIPVIVYVSPDGARAASAGVWIAQAADVLAMAPTTNIGSSTPIDSSGQNLGSDLRRKVINDSAASLTALAAAHKRNTTWPALAVRKASNLTAQQALQMNVIDFDLAVLPALLDSSTATRRRTPQRPFTLHLAGAHIDYAKPGFFTRLLNALIDPNIIAPALPRRHRRIGFEIFHPGIVLPGALGGVALLTALFGFSVLPISWAGLALILLGVGLLVIDAHVVTHGALTVAGPDQPRGRDADALPQRAGAVPHVAAARPLDHARARRLLGVRDREGGAGPAAARRRSGRTRSSAPRASSATPGQVFVGGELWRAHRADGAPLVPGEHVRVDARGRPRARRCE